MKEVLGVAIRLKSAREIELMRRAGKVVHAVLSRLGEMIEPGITTAELDAQAERLTRSFGAECLFKGVPGRQGPFPGNICVSINDEVVHGIPSEKRIIRQGDVVSIDFGCRLDGYCGDAARTFIVGGKASHDVHRLVNVTREALKIAVEMAKPGILWSTVARAMQNYVEKHGFSVVKEFVGHGIGTEMHEDPRVPNFVSKELLKNDILLEEGLVIAVEPMVTMGSSDVIVAEDGWTVRTRDGKPAAHFEDTLAITSEGVQVLTNGN